MAASSNPRVLRRFIILMAIATFVMFSVWTVIKQFKETPAGDYEVRAGDILLSDGEYEDAIVRFEEALAVQPDHRGALSGKAVALIELRRYDDAIQVLTYLIDYLRDTLEDDDVTGRGALSAAHANRGIVRDRQGLYEEALEDYVNSVRVDRDLAEGPGVVDRILYYDRKPSSVLARARYIHEQLQLPPEKRLMRVPEEDAKQRLYKP